MDFIDVVGRINSGEKVGQVAKDLGISQSTLSRKLKENGFVYNNKFKVYEKKSENIVNNSEDNQIKMVEKDKNVLTDDEIKFLKQFYKISNSSDKYLQVSIEKSKLPPRKPEKKTSYIISKNTYDEFRRFSENLENEYRVSQNELVEIALNKLMREWSLY